MAGVSSFAKLCLFCLQPKWHGLEYRSCFYSWFPSRKWILGGKVDILAIIWMTNKTSVLKVDVIIKQKCEKGSSVIWYLQQSWQSCSWSVEYSKYLDSSPAPREYWADNLASWDLDIKKYFNPEIFCAKCLLFLRFARPKLPHYIKCWYFVLKITAFNLNPCCNKYSIQFWAHSRFSAWYFIRSF